MTKSINQNTIKHSKGDYAKADIKSLVLFELGKLGYKGLNDQAYKEQSYYLKSIIRNTADHGKYALHLIKNDTDKTGLLVLSSNDCQFPILVYTGLIINDQVLPMIEVLNLKHLANQLESLENTDFNVAINEANESLFALISDWKKTVINPTTCKNAFTELNQYKASLMNCLPVVTVIAKTKIELFQELVLSFLQGHGKAIGNLKKVRAIKELRRIRQLTNKMIAVLA